jgi:hypothetical protein
VIRLAWRQFRAEATIAAAAVVVVAIVLGVTGPHLVHVYDTEHSQVTNTYHALDAAVYFIALVTPALLGVFFGAPLIARELETGTFRLVWTQSVSRSRWLVVKFALVGVAVSLVAGGLSLMAAWWANPINVVNANRFSPANFGVFGIVPFGYALFAFALGATTGLLLRRTVAAMATTLVGYVGARLAATYWVRPFFEAPAHLSIALTKLTNLGFTRSTSGQITMNATPPNLPNAWAFSASIVDKAGRAPTSQYIQKVCPTFPKGPSNAVTGGVHTSVGPVGGFQPCVARLATRFHEVVTYQPASRYWPFQLYETALYVAVAVALGALSVWWVRRRLV